MRQALLTSGSNCDGAAIIASGVPCDETRRRTVPSQKPPWDRAARAHSRNIDHGEPRKAPRPRSTVVAAGGEPEASEQYWRQRAVSAAFNSRPASAQKSRRERHIEAARERAPSCNGAEARRDPRSPPQWRNRAAVRGNGSPASEVTIQDPPRKISYTTPNVWRPQTSTGRGRSGREYPGKAKAGPRGHGGATSCDMGGRRSRSPSSILFVGRRVKTAIVF